MPRLKVTQLRSKVGARPEHRETLRSLGLKRIGDVVVKVDDKLVTSVSSFFALTRAALNTDRATSITVLREGNELSVSVQGTDLLPLHPKTVYSDV